MTTSSDQRNPVEILAEEYLDRKRRGEKPTLREYLDRYAEFADEIRELFPALLMMEDLGDDSGATTGSLAGDGDGAMATGVRLQSLGDYRILREIGRGGMGVVYEAEQESLGRRVALKVLSAGALIDPTQVRRFEREAKAAAKLHHTNIVPVFGVGQQDGHHYYVMQFIAGLGLDLVLDDLRRLRHAEDSPNLPAAPGPDVVDRHEPAGPSRSGLTAADVARSLVTGQFARNGRTPGGTTEPVDGAAATTPPPVAPEGSPKADSSSVVLPGSSELSALSDSDRRYYQSVARIGVQVAEAMDYANRQGILHRDIKPSNLLLDNRGNVWVADFGLAKTAEADDLTHTGDILGTIRYMAPERFEGKCDARSDVYSLGLTLYELVALRPAYQAADRHALMEQVLHEEPARLKKRAPGVPRDLETIIAKAVARDPAARYATAGALGEDLQRFVEDRPIRARRAGLAERAWRWSRRNKAVASLLAALFVVLAAVAIGSSLAAVRFDRLARSERVATGRATEKADELESQLYFSDVALAYHECLAKNPGRAEKLLDGCPIRLRGWEWHYLKRQSDTALLTIPAHDDYVFNVVYSPDGKTLASSSQDGTAKVWDAATGRLIHDLRGHYPDICWRVTYSPDGTMLASVGRDRTVKIWDSASGRLIRSLLGHQGTVMGVAFSPVGHLLVSAGHDSVKLWDTKTWREIQTLPGGWHVVFSPDGRRLASAGSAGLKIWDTAALETGTGPVAPSWSSNGPFIRMAFSPDSRSIAIGEGGRANVVTVLDAETGRRIRPPLTGHSDLIQDVVYSPDGRYIASASWDETVRVWDSKAGGLLHTFRGHTERVIGIAFDPTGRWIASASLDGTVKLWDVTKLGELAVQEARTLAVHSGNGLGVMYSLDGRSFATVGGSDSGSYIPARVEAVTVWDAKTGREIRTIPNPTASACHDVAFDPSFGRIAWAHADGTVEIRDAMANRLVLTLSGHTGPVWRVAFSPEGRQLASASRDKTVRVWDAATGRLIHVLPGFSPPIEAPAIRCLRFSPDGHRLALAGLKSDQLHPVEVKVWDASTGRQLPTLGGYFDEVHSMAFHPREGRIACAVGSVIHILEMASGREVLRLHGHTNTIGGLAFSSDGLRLASAGKDGTVKLWEAATGREILTLLHGRGDQLNGVSISPDGWQIVSVGKSGTIKVWDATPLPESSDATRPAQTD